MSIGGIAGPLRDFQYSFPDFLACGGLSAFIDYAGDRGYGTPASAAISFSVMESASKCLICQQRRTFNHNNLQEHKKRRKKQTVSTVRCVFVAFYPFYFNVAAFISNRKQTSLGEGHGLHDND